MHANPHESGGGDRAPLRNLIADSERLISEAGKEGAQRYGDVVSKLRRRIRRARDDLDDMQYAAGRHARAAARRADRYAQANPWKVAVIAVAVGTVVGAIVTLALARR